MTKQDVVNKIVEHTNIKGGYVLSPEDNLITPFSNWKQIESEIGHGQRHELKVDKRNGKVKFCAVYSSTVLCVNNFAPIKESVNKTEFNLFGYSGFENASFEKKVHIGLGTPNLDFFIENNNVSIGIESKFTEHFEASLKHTKEKLCEYYNSPRLKFLPQDFMNKVILPYISEPNKMFLDAAQLIKHTIGLLKLTNKTGKKAVLVYIYWLPYNFKEYDVCIQHEEEIKQFATRIKTFIDFVPISYIDF
jgi:hypothetical protein